jgi:hypothetical protein
MGTFRAVFPKHTIRQPPAADDRAIRALEKQLSEAVERHKQKAIDRQRAEERRQKAIEAELDVFQRDKRRAEQNYYLGLLYENSEQVKDAEREAELAEYRQSRVRRKYGLDSDTGKAEQITNNEVNDE